MLSYVISIRSVCTRYKLGLYLTRFLKYASFKTQYINIQLNFHCTNNEIVNIGAKYLLDIKDDRDINTYKFYIQQYFELNYLKNNDVNSINKIVFNYSELSKKEYLKIKKMG